MLKFRKKPVVIEATQYTETIANTKEIVDWTKDSKTPAISETVNRNRSEEYPSGFDYPVLRINSLEGLMTVQKGDWVIKGVNGEFYPCKPDIFEKTYEPAE